ncbi:MAG: NAD(P)H-dependent oxidoreductase [Chlamydiia bacterium]|nr:NAD(P)H-dependent oxidoreductase [Chlamydiia bacterium]
MFKKLLTLLLLGGGVLSAETRVLAISGSLREDSCNTKLVKEAALEAKRQGAEVMVIDLRDFPIPFYDGDLESKEGMPPHAKRLRQLMISSQAIFIATPEYNGSPSAVLKNALDWASRNEQGQPSREAFQGKKFAVMSASPGGGGGSRAAAHLQSILQNMGGTVVSTKVAVPSVYDAFDSQGKLKSQQLRIQLQQQIQEALK